MVAFGEYSDDGTASTMKARDYKDATDLAVMTVHGTQDPDTNIELAHTLGRNQGQENAVFAQCVTGDITHTLKAEGFDASEDGTGRGQPIVPAISLQTDVTPKASEELAFTLKLPSSSGGDQPAAAMTPDLAVRRLTPVECERLQDFPDNHTLIPVAKRNKLTADELAYLRHHFPDMPEEEAHRQAADGPRYKAIGNSMAVPCMEWIGRRIVSILAPL